MASRRRFALGLLVLAPVVLLVLLPAVLGLQRYVVTDRSMDGVPGRGSVVLAREVPAADLEVGDVITFRLRRTASSDERVHPPDRGHRGRRRHHAQADTTGSTDPWARRR